MICPNCQKHELVVSYAPLPHTFPHKLCLECDLAETIEDQFKNPELKK